LPAEKPPELGVPALAGHKRVYARFFDTHHGRAASAGTWQGREGSSCRFAALGGAAPPGVDPEYRRY
jgi:hypothetical protein